MRTAIRLLSFLRPLSGWVALSVLIAVATIASNIGLLGTSAYLIARAALHPSVAELQVAIVGVRFFGISRSLLRYLERLVSHSANFRLLAGLRTWFFRHLEPLAPARLLQTRRGDLLERVIADIDGLEDFYVRAVAPPLTALLVTLGMGAFLGAAYPQLGAALVAGLILSGVGVPWLARQLGRAPGAALVAERTHLSAGLVDFVQGLPDLLSCGAGEQYISSLRIVDCIAGRAQVHLANQGGFANALNGLSTHLTLWVLLLLAIPLVRAGEMDGVTLAVVALVTLASFEATLPLGPAAQRLETSLRSADRLFEIADAAPAVMNPAEPAPLPAGNLLEFRRLTFSYALNLPPALQDFSLLLPPGKRVGIVGPSGGGKSTLISILLRFWEVPAGQVLLDGRELSEYAQQDVRNVLAVIPAAPYLFSGTIRSNLLLARPRASAEDIFAALRQASLEDWVARLPQGLDTWVGERGLQVSGGELQRLAVARALLQEEARIWLLDEPTGQLDPRTRQAVAATLMACSRGKSVIWISHHLEELSSMDEILVLRQGHVVERGTPAGLIAQSGWYARWASAYII